MTSLLESVATSIDRGLGDAITRSVRRHHERRIARIGWEGALDPQAGGWAAGSPPPRAGNTIAVLVDGANALPSIASELERAESHVHIAGWYFSPEFRLVREGEQVVLRDLVARLSERIAVRVLA